MVGLLNHPSLAGAMVRQVRQSTLLLLAFQPSLSLCHSIASDPFNPTIALSMNTHESYSRGQHHPIVHPYPHGSSLSFCEELDSPIEDRVGENGSLVGTTLILLSGIHLVDGDYLSGGEDG